jgi:peptidyl-prolyl cis-trans isomerase A (cyclophilin A)
MNARVAGVFHRWRPVPVISAGLLSALCFAGASAQSTARDLTRPDTFKATAPETFNAVFDTSVGTFVVRVTRAWAPHGADRFYNLVAGGFYDNCRFFRVVPKFMAQFGIHGDPAVSAAWQDATIPAERARESNTRGRVTFAQGTLASSRTTQVFINFGNNSKLDIDNFAPFGEVITSMLIVERIYGEYGEGIDQRLIQSGGNAVLEKVLPKLSYIRRATVETRSHGATEDGGTKARRN